MSTRSRTTVLPSLADALAWLAENDAKTAATYCEADGTVTSWRKRYHRRPNGTIVGYHDGARGSWESYAEDVRKHVARRLAKADEAASVAAYMQREEAERTRVSRSNIRDAVRALREFRSAFQRELHLVPEAHRNIVLEAAASREADLVERVRFFWARR